MSRHYYSLAAMFVLVIVASYPSPLPAQTNNWEKSATFSASLSDVATSHVDNYANVSGLSGTEESFSWITNLDADFKRQYDQINQEHRVHLRYGKLDGVEQEDEIDLDNIVRLRLNDYSFTYGNARVRSEFDKFGHPTQANASVGLGSNLLDSRAYGTLQLRTGPRMSRGWNPSVDWEKLYELLLEYELQFNETNKFTSQLETYTEIDTVENYTARWDNNLTAASTSGST
ncbi:MAG: DUF481 domain-containing protein [bacterium]